MRVTVRRLRGDDGGFVLISVILVSMLLMSLLVVTLAQQDHADQATVRSRNFDTVVSVAEAGIQDGIARIQAANGGSVGAFLGSTAQGSYSVTVTKTPGHFVIESRGTTSGALQRTRVVQVTLDPPSNFTKALYSNTSIDMKNNDSVTGDVWANTNIETGSGVTVTGSVTSATGWIDLEGSSKITKDAWSGGYDKDGPFAIQLGTNAEIDGNASAAVASPADPTTCGGEQSSNYAVPLAGGSKIVGSLRTWGVKSGSGTVQGTYSPNTCVAAAIPAPLPSFAYNATNYDSSTLHEFTSVTAFQTWLLNHLTSLTGTFYVNDSSPSQLNRVDLTGVTITGDTTIISVAPIYANGVTDSGTNNKLVVMNSSYQPPAGSACSVNNDLSECAIHLKNNFQASCYAAVLMYANRGPVALKNNNAICGAVYADSILAKNVQTLTYDSRVARVVGYGAQTYVTSRWSELSP